MHCYFADYDPRSDYIHQDMVALISQQRRLLSMFALASGQRRCAVGLDFEDYDPQDGSVPVYLLGKPEMMALASVEGKKLLRAFRASQVGKNLIVTYNTPLGRGWFSMRFELGEKGLDWQVFPPSMNSD
jgi:hypothetical protein